MTIDFFEHTHCITSKLKSNKKTNTVILQNNNSKGAFTVSWSNCSVSSGFSLADDTVEVPVQGFQQRGPHLKV